MSTCLVLTCARREQVQQFLYRPNLSRLAGQNLPLEFCLPLLNRGISTKHLHQSLFEILIEQVSCLLAASPLEAAGRSRQA